MAALVISYSRRDRSLIRAIAALLRTAIPNLDRAVYWDDALEAGLPWEEQIESAIDQVPQVFVFWCIHSSESAEVSREYTYALTKRKRVVPVLLDNTPLPALLASIHGIDLRGIVRHRGRRAPGSHGALPELTDAEEIEQSRTADIVLPESYLTFERSQLSELPQQIETARERLAFAFHPFFK